MSRHTAHALLDQLSREAKEIAERVDAQAAQAEGGGSLESLLAEVEAAKAEVAKAPAPPKLDAGRAHEAELTKLINELQAILPGVAHTC